MFESSGAQPYVVGFTIFDGRSLQTEDGLPAATFVVVETCGYQWQSETMEGKISLVPWNETYMWSSIELYAKEFEAASVEFRVYARNWFSRNYLIGKASLQLSFVNQKRHHVYARRWLCLRRDESPACTGMLNITLFVLKPGEQAPSLTEQMEAVDDGMNEGQGDGGDKDVEDLNQAVEKTTIEAPAGRPYHVKINIHRVEDLLDMGYSKPNPYVTVEFAGILQSTRSGSQVNQFTFNDSIQIPVITPLYEDTIIVKLWHSNWLSPDELLAQGFISFSELRNNSLPPRWFNLYGWDPEEIPDVTTVSAAGQAPEPSFFKGRLLISGHVDRLEDETELEEAKRGVARPIVEPNMIQVALLSDVFMVVGADGRNCKVELKLGSVTGETQWAPKDRQTLADKMAEESSAKGPGQVQGDDDDAETADGMGYMDWMGVLWKDMNSFWFTQAQGKIDPLLCLTPEDPISQPVVMVNVYTDSLLYRGRRIAYTTRFLKDLTEYDPGNPAKPKFYPLETMPDMAAASSNPPSVLMTIETYGQDDVPRHSRKIIKPMIYIVRAYVFMARNITYAGMRPDAEPDDLQLRVTCAGISSCTKLIKGPRPLWMEARDLRVILCSDSTREPPTIEPITLTLMQGGSLYNGSLGKAVCVYTHMRQKNSLQKWEPFDLRPQWVKCFGGTYGNQSVGEVLVAFELLLYRNRDEVSLQPRSMWPQREEVFDKTKHFSCLRKATLHFSMHGLRDLLPLPLVASVGSSAVSKPLVKVSVERFAKPGEDSDEGTNQTNVLEFRYRDVMEGGNKRVRAERLKVWNSDAMGYTCKNYEFLQVGKMNVEIPDKMLLQPYVRIAVYEEPTSTWFGSPTLVGESLQSLGDVLPCCWLEGVTKEKTFQEQEKYIADQLRKARTDAQVRDAYEQMSDEMRQEIFRQSEKQMRDAMGKTRVDLIAVEEDKPAKLDDKAMPLQLREAPSFNKRRLQLIPLRQLNMHIEKPFSPRLGASSRQSGLGVRKTCSLKLEDSTDPPFKNDFWYKKVPLLRNSDIIDRHDTEIDWNFQPGRTFGFVKCTYKLTDGWSVKVKKAKKTKMSSSLEDESDGEEENEEDEDEDEEEEEAEQEEEEEEDEEEEENEEGGDKKEDDQHLLGQSYKFDRHLDRYAFKEKSFNKKFKAVPARVRCRLYFVKGVCIYGKSTGFADPFLDFRIGRTHRVSMKNMVTGKPTNAPEFYRMEERDIILPDDSRLEISVMDMDDLGLGDTLIGATVIDLEDRWHSPRWITLLRKGIVPQETRSLYTSDYPGKNRGNIDMWVELIESVQASDTKPSDISRPADTELEVRFVIWGCSKVKPVSGDHSHAQVIVKLDCKEYGGLEPLEQPTDVHYGSTGDAKFNWRIVFPKIQMPTKSCGVQISLFHYELLGSTPIGSLDLNLKRYCERVAKDMDKLVIGPSDLEFTSFEAQAAGGQEKAPGGGESKEKETVGFVRVQMWVMTSVEAEAKAQGTGREDPNDDPQLICPTEGRDWGTYLASLGFGFPSLGLWKKLIPPIIAMILFLISVIALKQIGLL